MAVKRSHSIMERPGQVWKVVKRAHRVYKHLTKGHKARMQAIVDRRSKGHRSPAKHQGAIAGGFITSPSAGESHSSGFYGRKHRHNSLEMTTVICDVLRTDAFNSNAQTPFETVFGFWGNNTFTTNPTTLTNANADVLQLNAFARRDAANTASTAPILGEFDKGRQLFVHSCKSESIFTNDGSTDIQIYIYDLVSKVTRTSDYNGFVSPLQLWAEGITAERDFAPAASGTVAVLGRLPTQTKIFNMGWKTMKLTKVELSAGRTHVHRFNFSPQMVVDMQYFNTNAVVKGVSCAQLVIVHGTNLVSAIGSIGANIGVSPGLLYSKTTAKYQVTPLVQPPKKIFVFENATANVSIVLTSEMNEETAQPLTGTFG